MSQSRRQSGTESADVSILSAEIEFLKEQTALKEEDFGKRQESTINFYRPSYAVGELSSGERPRRSNDSKINFYSPSFIAAGRVDSDTETTTPRRISSTIGEGYVENLLKLEEINALKSGDQSKEKVASENLEEESSSDECDTVLSYGFEEIPGTWGTHGLEPEPWDDKDRPVPILNTYKKLNLTEDEENGILTDRIMSACSSYLDRCPETGQFVLCKANLEGINLRNIDILGYHHYLQYVNLSNNKLEDLEPLGQLPFLMYLDVSHNNLTEVLQFRAPFNLTYADFSHNIITSIDDLTNFWSLVYLDLSYNIISKIKGLENLKYLKHLNLSNNEIEWIENLNNMVLETLNLENNNICDFERGEKVGFQTLHHIVNIKLGYNFLKTLGPFRGASNIQSIEMQMNHINDLFELTHLRNLQYLTVLDLTNNVVTSADNYWEVALSSLQSVMFLDGVYIDSASKIMAFRKYRASVYMKAMEKQSLVFFNSQLNNPSITASVVPVDQPPPLIVILVGPPGSKKKCLIHQIFKEFPHIVRLGVSHTTRAQVEDEKDGFVYHFVSPEIFAKMVRDGEFLTVSEIIGNCYGFAQGELEKVTEAHLVLLTHMDLSSALTLRAKGLRPYLILTLPSSDEMHRIFLREKYFCVSNPRECSPIIKNCPSLARNFYDGQEHNVPDSIMSLIKESLNDCINNAVIEGSPEGGMKEEVKITNEDLTIPRIEKSSTDLDSNVEEETDDEKNLVCIYSSYIQTERESTSNAHTFGILKQRGSKIKKSHSVQQRPSFDPHISRSSDMLKNMMARSRSVTFSENRFLKTNDELKGMSASSSALDDEDTSCPILSVLSKAEKGTLDSTDSNEMLVPGIQISSVIEYEGPMALFFNEVITLRRTFLEFHLANPGIFCETIFSDDGDIALEKIRNVMQLAFSNYPTSKHFFNYTEDPLFDSMVKERLNDLSEELIKSFHNVGECTNKIQNQV